MQKTEQGRWEGTPVKDFIKVLFVMYFTTLVLLLLLAFALYKMEVSEMLAKIWLIGIYAISGFLGGFLIGKRRKSRKFLWGFFTGCAYVLILFAISMLLYRGFSGNWTHLATTLVLCVASGTAGGMVS